MTDVTSSNKQGITPEADIVIQSYLTMRLWNELMNNQFLESEYFNNLKFSNDSVKFYVSGLGMGNQGARMMMLYLMTVIPYELVSKNMPNDVKALNIELGRLLAEHSRSNYSYDCDCIQYFRRIRNAISHGEVSFTSNGMNLKDSDKNGNESKILIPNDLFPKVLRKFSDFFDKYIENLT